MRHLCSRETQQMFIEYAEIMGNVLLCNLTRPHSIDREISYTNRKSINSPSMYRGYTQFAYIILAINSQKTSEKTVKLCATRKMQIFCPYLLFVLCH